SPLTFGCARSNISCELIRYGGLPAEIHQEHARSAYLGGMSEIQTTGRRREVGAELKRIRQQTDQPAYKVAAKLGWTASHISRSEAGKRRVTDVDAGHYLGICGAPDNDLQEILKIVNEPDDYRLQLHEDRIPDEL